MCELSAERLSANTEPHSGVSRHVVALLTVHNRREVTRRCLDQLHAMSTDTVRLSVVVVDDGSSDGTSEMIRRYFPTVHLVLGSGDLYWGGGMRMAEALALEFEPDYLLWVNDDTDLYADAIQRVMGVALAADSPVVVCGALHGASHSATTYSGAIARRRWHISFDLIPVDPSSECATRVDTCNGNFVLIPKVILDRVGGIDPHFTHHWGDFDFGLRVTKSGYQILLAPGFVGRADRNNPTGGFRDAGMPRARRLRDLNSPRGYPAAEKRLYLSRHGEPLWLIQLWGVWLHRVWRIIRGVEL